MAFTGIYYGIYKFENKKPQLPGTYDLVYLVSQPTRICSEAIQFLTEYANIWKYGTAPEQAIVAWKDIYFQNKMGKN